MHIVKFDKRNLQYKEIGINIYLIGLLILVILSSLSCYFTYKSVNNISSMSEETKLIILRNNDTFTEEKLKSYILELNIRFPHIVLAQARLESNNFKSRIFLENNNLFGMRVAISRPTMNKGEQYGHAMFNTWRESVVDYAFYQAAYLKDIKTENEYLDYLKQSYSETDDYVERLKTCMK